MNKETLQTLRVLIPGALVVLLFLTLNNPSLSLVSTVQTLELKDGTLGIAVVAIFGALYYVFDIRAIGLGRYWEDVDAAIKSRLMQILPGDETPLAEERNALLGSRAILDVFYRVLDKDPTLTARSTSVYLNGLMVTSIGDFANVCGVGALLHLVLAYYHSRLEHAYFTICLAVLYIISQIILVPLLIRKHKGLSGDQLTYIESHLRNEVQEGIRNALRRVREAPRVPSRGNA